MGKQGREAALLGKRKIWRQDIESCNPVKRNGVAH